MNSEKRIARGLCLLSGGLDSQLAVCVLRDQGIYVEGMVFDSPFFKITVAQQAARQLGIICHVYPFTPEILKLIHKPKHGFGGAMNPCIDCHASMIRLAGEWITEHGFDFVATGEVLNQRPMSQNRRALEIVACDADLGGCLLRPLSALLLEPTLPEQQGLVDRTQLLGLSGRSRKPQVMLAERFGLKEYPTPAGGCLLTEKGFCRKLADLQQHEGLAKERLVKTLVLGRHLRLPEGTKCIVGRDSSENDLIEQCFQPEMGDVLLYTVSVAGPTVLIPQGGVASEVVLAAQVTAGYGDCGKKERVTVCVKNQQETQELSVTPLPKSTSQQWLC